MNRAIRLALLGVLATVAACSKGDQKSAPVDTTLADDGPAATAPVSTPTERPPNTAPTQAKSDPRTRQVTARDFHDDAGESQGYDTTTAPDPARVGAAPTGPSPAIPRGNPASWSSTNDYPTRALREERSGTTAFRVTVGVDGRVTDCTIVGSSGSPDLDEATCSNVTGRARFTPATDTEGNPTTGTYTNRIRWIIPSD